MINDKRLNFLVCMNTDVVKKSRHSKVTHKNMYTRFEKGLLLPPSPTRPCPDLPFPGFLAFSSLSEWFQEACGGALVIEVQNFLCPQADLTMTRAPACGRVHSAPYCGPTTAVYRKPTLISFLCPSFNVQPYLTSIPAPSTQSSPHCPFKYLLPFSFQV